MGNVTADYVLPGGRERSLGELLSTMLNNPVKHWNFLCPFASFQNSSFCDCTMKKRLPNAGGLSNRYANKVLQLADILGSWTFSTLDNIKTDPITLGQRFKTFSLYRGMG
jgi:hypothetical protein